MNNNLLEFSGSVDLIATAELADKFIYCWYPSADDLLIVSQHFNWIIGVRHDGALFFHTEKEDDL